MENIHKRPVQAGKKEIKKNDLKTSEFMAAVIFLLLGNLTIIYTVHWAGAIVSVALLAIVL